MALLKRKKWWHNPAYTRAVTVVVLVLCVLMAVSVYDRYTIEREMADRRAAVEAELVALEDRQMSLEEKVTYLRQERGVEAEIRRNFDVAKEGEQVIVLVDKRRSNEAPSTALVVSEPETLWQSLWPW